MKTRLLNVWEALNTSLWFVPTIMATSAIVLSFVSVAWDANLNTKLARSMSWLWSGGADGARSLLSTIAGSMMTVTGVVFSITMVTLTLASSQFGSRLLRNFMRDRGNQIVLGTFISTFVYCLLVLRTVRSTSEGSFVPYISVTLGVVFALCSLGVLIFFIHHVAGSIQAESLTAEVGTEFRKAVDKLCTSSANAPEEKEPGMDDMPSLVVRAEESGYVLSVDRDTLVEEAAAAGLRVRLVCQPGDFVLRGGAMAQVWVELAGAGGGKARRAHGQGDMSDDQEKPEMEDTPTKLRRAFTLGERRTPTQDVRYSARQLVDIASRALSPGINDPFTAIGCMDWLAAGLSELARQPVPARCRRDGTGEVRLWEVPVDFAELAGRCFEPIRSYGKDSALVTGHLLKVLGDLGRTVQRDEDLTVLRRLVKRITKESGEYLEGAEIGGLLTNTSERLQPTSSDVDGSRLPAGESLEI